MVYIAQQLPMSWVEDLEDPIIDWWKVLCNLRPAVLCEVGDSQAVLQSTAMATDRLDTAGIVVDGKNSKQVSNILSNWRSSASTSSDSLPAVWIKDSSSKNGLLWGWWWEVFNWCVLKTSLKGNQVWASVNEERDCRHCWAAWSVLQGRGESPTARSNQGHRDN